MASVRPYARAYQRGLAIAGAGALLAVAACGRETADAEPTPAAAGPIVTLRDADDVIVLEARISGARCAVTGTTELTVERATTADGTLLTAKVGAAVVLTMTSDRDAFRITGADGAARARVVRGDRRTDVLAPDGIALARISASDDEATVVDASRAPVARAVRDGAGLVTTAADGAIASVTGTSDLELAALLTAPGIPADLRAVLACDRLLAVASPSAGPAHSTPAAPASPDPAVSDPTP